jgi:hypothetical protein
LNRNNTINHVLNVALVYDRQKHPGRQIIPLFRNRSGQNSILVGCFRITAAVVGETSLPLAPAANAA